MTGITSLALTLALLQPPAVAPVELDPAEAPPLPEEDEDEWELGPDIPTNRELRRAAREQRPSFRERGNKVFGVPMLHLDPATGFVFGIRARYVNRAPGEKLNRVQLDLESSISLRLVQKHVIGLRLRDLTGRDEITEFTFRFVDEPVFPYFGVVGEEDRTFGDPIVGASNEDFEEEPFIVRMFGMESSAIFQYPLLVWRPERTRSPEPLTMRWIGGLRFGAERLTALADTIYAAEGRTSGWVRRGSVLGGLMVGNRDNEFSPRAGGLHDLTVEAAGPWMGATSIWTRLNASSRFYWSLLPDDSLVWAQRFVADVVVGEPPLVTLGQFGGLYPIEGYGGIDAGRGFYRRRFIGPYKLLTTPEIRWQPVDLPVRRWRLGLGLNAFADLGAVLPEEDPELGDFHIAGGFGAFLIWDDFFPFRVELGASREGTQLFLSAGHNF